MHRNQIEKDWHQLKSDIRKKWNKLTDEDIERINGKYDALVEKLQKRYGSSREHVEEELKFWVHEGKKAIQENKNRSTYSNNNKSSCGGSCGQKYNPSMTQDHTDHQQKKRKAS